MAIMTVATYVYLPHNRHPSLQPHTSELSMTILPTTSTQPRANQFLRSSLVVALGLALWCPGNAQAAEPAADGTGMEAKMKQGCQEMMQKKAKMMEETKAGDATLTEELGNLNAAPDDKKIELMTVVITHMAEQRIAEHARMAKMQEQMMQHMMGHMQMGKESMSMCPMMKGMDGKTQGMDKK
jgi:hypothetical protein